MDEPHPAVGTPGDLLRTAALGFVGGLRTTIPFLVESAYLAHEGPDIADGGPVLDFLATPLAVRVLSLAALIEIVLDKTPFVPDRLLPVPLGTRVIVSGVAGALMSLAEGRTSDSGALAGSIGGALGSVAGHAMRTRLPLPGWLLALAEDGLAIVIGRWAVLH